MKTMAGILLLGAALMTPGQAAPDDHDRDRDRSPRYYDNGSKDWHHWNQDEERAYKQYLKEQKRQYRHWSKSNKQQQQDYWRWRHSHNGDYR